MKWNSPHNQQKSLTDSTLHNLKNDRMISVHFQGKPFNIMVIQVYAPTVDAEEADIDHFYNDLEDLLELTPKKKKMYSSLGIGIQKWEVKDHLE